VQSVIGPDIRRSPILVLLLLAAASLTGCRSTSPAPLARATTAPILRDPELTDPTAVPVVNAVCRPPVGWKLDPPKHSAQHDHLVWISPSGRTAYGVIYFHLPLPVGHELALWGFLNEMRASEGEAKLLQKNWDSNLNCLRFVAEGGQYTVRTNLFVRGWTGWAVYAGTLRAFAINAAELAVARRAREATEIGLSR
jgi:hypothetical protein